MLHRSEINNRLIRRLSDDDFGYLASHLRKVDMPFKHVLHEADVAITSVYFPEHGYASMLAMLEDGETVEVGMVGSEGMIGVPIVYGTDRSTVEALVQGGGTALRIEADAFRTALLERVKLKQLLLLYAMAFAAQITTTAACNGRHLLEQRLARWLLMAHDRSETDEFAMTQDFLSRMLGVRRAGVSVAAGALRKAGLIRFSSGRVEIVDRPGLEAAACECHRSAQREFNRILKQD